MKSVINTLPEDRQRRLRVSVHVLLAGVPEGDLPEDAAFPLVDLSGVQDVVGVHGLLDRLDGGQRGRPLLLEVGCLGDSHSVLSGDGSAQIDANIEDLVDRGDSSLPLVLVSGVDDHLGVEVSVGSVTVGRDGYPVLVSNLLEGFHRIGDLGDGDTHVVGQGYG